MQQTTIDIICQYWHIMITGVRKPLFWMGSTRRDLKNFPDEVQDVIGHALDMAQRGKKYRDAKSLSGVE